MSRSWILVPRPRVRRSKPVAIGSSVPQWPTFFICKRRRTIATTSCEVIPAALSTRRTPSGVAVNDTANLLQDFRFHFRQGPPHSRTGRELVSAAPEPSADRGDIRGIGFRPHAHANFTFGKLFEENGDDDTLNRPDVINQAFVVLRFRAEARGRFQAQTEARDSSLAFEAHRAQQF